MEQLDTIVIGAGAAGLAAAHTLATAGLRVAIVEARDRIGGRILTVRQSQGVESTLVAELGAEFIHGRPASLLTIARDARLTLCEMLGTDWVERAGQITPANDEAPSLKAFSDAIRAHATQELDQSAQAFMNAYVAGGNLAATSPDAERADQATERQAPAVEPHAIRRWASTFIEQFDAAPLSSISTHWLAHEQEAEEAIDDDRQFWVVDGYDRILHWLLEDATHYGARLVLNTAVQAVHWAPQDVRLDLVSGTAEQAYTESLSARTLISTLPLGVLAAPAGVPGSVTFDPALHEKVAALNGLGIGHVVKVVLTFDTYLWDLPVAMQQSVAFPRADRQVSDPVQLPQLSFLFTDDPLVPVYWTRFPLMPVTPMLTAWVGGPQAEQLASRSTESIRDAILASLSRTLQAPRESLDAHLLGVQFHNWSSDPYARGAYSYVRVGGLQAQTQLRQPVADTLFFAGEATDDSGHAATVHGAVASGERAAHEVLQRMSAAM